MSNQKTGNHPKTPRGVFIATMIMAVLFLVPSMFGFINKLFEFARIARSDPNGAFAMTPIMNYTFASIGFFFLLLWATFQGMFRDIESPKHTMLEREDELDVNEPNHVPVWAGGPRKVEKG
ncbi:MAG: hypothetical protein KDA69_15410 [Planctomycetaceae bacterium]|nr:hypothetical protein [Planctomycetaceae bacterium]